MRPGVSYATSLCLSYSTVNGEETIWKVVVWSGVKEECRHRVSGMVPSTEKALGLVPFLFNIMKIKSKFLCIENLLSFFSQSFRSINSSCIYST